MKPAPFAYVRATSLAHALDVLAEHGDDALVLAGGQSLVPMLNLRLVQPAVVLDINALQALATIETDPADGGLRLGALVRHREIASHPTIAARAPLLRDAAPWIAHPAVRHRGTLGGSLALGDPAAEWPACAVALDATILLASRSAGTRAVPAAAFFQGLYQSDRRADELLVGCNFAPLADDAVFSFRELARRHGDYATVGLALSACGRPGAWREVRLVFFGVGDTPVQATACASALAAGAGFAHAQARLEAELDPRADLWFSAQAKRHLAVHLLREAWRGLGNPMTGN
jgi:carbon-monoxide dehydrogenase medium subunit